MKKFVVVGLLVFLCGLSASAQEKKFEFQDVCGDPTMESMSYSVLNGEVVKIVDGDTVIFKQSNGKKTVDLVTVDASSNDAAAKDFLAKALLKRKVEVLVSLNSDRKRFWGLVRRDDGVVNRRMIELGVAAFRTPEPYAFSNYSTCVYQKMEEKAKQEKLGIWAK